jgi:hypothetical protein
MFKILQETTDWSDCDYQVCNHTYLISPKGKVIAYANEHTGDIVKLKNGWDLNKRYRKFIEVVNPALSALIPKDYQEEKLQKPQLVKSSNIRNFKVLSKGKQYYVSYNISRNFYNCNCTGFGYRKTCSHVKAVAEKQQA